MAGRGWVYINVVLQALKIKLLPAVPHKILLLGACILICSSLKTHFVNGDPAFSFVTQDSVLVDVFAIQEDGILTGYTARVGSPICEKTECYEVELDFYWNLIGDFERYVIVPEKPLTKREHEPFTAEDYQKLSEVLKMENPAFAGMEKEAMISNWVSDGVDGLTGATVAAIKQDIVPGAAYSCYTLWHIAHGPVVDSIRRHSSKRLDSSILYQLMQSSEERVHYYLIEFLPDDLYASHREDLVQFIFDKGGYFSRYAIREMPNHSLSDSLVQSKIGEHFSTLDYFAQINLIERLKSVPLADDLALLLIDQLPSHRSALYDGMIEALTGKHQDFDFVLKELLINALVGRDIPLEEQIIERITDWSETKSWKKKIKKLKKR